MFCKGKVKIIKDHNNLKINQEMHAIESDLFGTRAHGFCFQPQAGNTGVLSELGGRLAGNSLSEEV